MHRKNTRIPSGIARNSATLSRLALAREGVEEHVVEGVTVRVFCPAKTVADCFKYRNKIGLDVALEALRESRRERRCSEADLWRYARICRVANVMRPYLEAITYGSTR